MIRQENSLPKTESMPTSKPAVKPYVRQRILSFSSLILACVIIIGAFSIVYLNNLQELVYNDSIRNLREISRKINANVENVINNNFAALDSIVTQMEEQGYDSLEDALSYLSDENKRWGFSQICLVDSAGNWLSNFGRSAYMGLWDTFSSAQEFPTMFTTARFGSINAVVFIETLDKPQIIEGKVVSAIACVYDLASFNDILALDAFEGNGYANIIDKNGNIVVYSNHPMAENRSQNLLELISTQKIDAGNNSEIFLQDIEHGEEGFIGYTLDGVHKYMTYIPISSYGWYLFSVVPASVINEKSNAFFQGTVLICIGIVLLLSIIFVLTTMNQYQTKKRLEELAYIDPVTGGNTQQRFEVLAEDLLRGDFHSYVLLYANLEKFKLINDREGREGGDRLLKEVYAALQSMLGQNEAMCRLSADHFALLLHCKGAEPLQERLRTLLPILEQIQVGEYEKRSFQISFGAYFMEEPGLEMTTMLTRANIARLSIKSSTVDGLRFGVYDDSIRRRMIREKELEERMNVALLYDEFKVYLQPKIGLAGDCVAGAEALVRWQPVDGSMIFPDEFIPLFERNGFIVRMDLYVFEQVCKLIRSWLDQGKEVFPISVNLSRANLHVPDFFDAYERVLKKEGIPPKYIEFEFTESIVYDNAGVLNSVIGRIHELGSTCSMDDFGSSYSSLNMLKDVDVDILKLDKAFFHETTRTDNKNMDIIEGIISLARKIHMRTVAEGVEKMEQVQFLRGIGCDIVQGYVYARPMPIADFEKFLQEHPELCPAS